MHTSTRRGISSAQIALLSLAGFAFISAVHCGAQTTPPARRPATRTQTAGNAGTVTGVVTDPSGAVVANATVTLSNSVSGLTRTTKTDGSGAYSITNIPFNTYKLNVTSDMLAPATQTVELQSFVPITANVTLQVATTSTTVEVTTSGSEMVETDPVGHTDVDRDLFSKIPLESLSSSVSSLVTLASPGVSADSNGMFHGMGDHASNSFSVDGQPITDQQSKTFSNQISMDSVQSLEVIPGAPSAEYGGKTSLVIVATTRSGLDNPQPHGEVNLSYGSFGSSSVGFNLAYGKQKAGNFISANVMNTGRFLDPPEFHAIHDKGNEENLFDRFDYQVNAADSLHLNLGYTRSWFQTPNSYDSQYATQWSTNLAGVPVGPDGKPVGAADQRAQIQTVNFSPSYTHVVNQHTVLNTNYFLRHDAFNYYPSKNPFADRGAPDLQQETIGQQRTLTNTGLLSNVTYTHGINNMKAGVSYTQTFLTENFQLGIVDPTLVPGLDCQNGNGSAIPGTPCATLLPYDLTAGGSLYPFHGHTDVKELAAYVQDAISAGPWGGNFGIRFDQYNGLTSANQVEPRMALSYKIRRTGTVLRVSYARTLESPFNENLVIASEGCNFPVIAALIPCTPSPNRPGFRNDFHAGSSSSFQSTRCCRRTTCGSTRIMRTTSQCWVRHRSRSPSGGITRRFPDSMDGLTFLRFITSRRRSFFSSVAARFFTPQTSGLGTIPTPPGSTVDHTPFRIDHDEKFNQTTHAQYQLGKRGPYVGFNWRFDSGQVAGAAPCYGTLAANDCPQTTTLNSQPAVNMQDPFGVPLTADQEAQAGFACNGVRASLGNPLPSTCLVSQFTSSLISLPGASAQNDDHNPPRVASRNLFDLSFGEDNLLHRKEGNQRTLSASMTIVNLTNKYALYNFLSTFSGTHFVTPRSITGEIAFHF